MKTRNGFSLLVIVAMAMIGTQRADAVVVADFVDDFVPGVNAGDTAGFSDLGNGWGYFWNAPTDWDGSLSANGPGGAINTISSYTALVWSGTQYSSDGDNNNGNGNPARFLRLADPSGADVSHTGRGGGQANNTQDRYVITAYMVELDGMYALTDSFFDTFGGAGNGNEIRVYTSLDPNTALLSTVFDNVSNAIFDVELGVLSAGDTVFVAIGPNNNAGSDSFVHDFSIALIIPEPTTATLGLIGLAGLVMRRRKAA